MYLQEINLYLDKLISVISKLDRNEINAFLSVIVDAYNREANIFICGNGGSASTASHMTCDLNKGVSLKQKTRLKVVSLTDNIPTILAYANDEGYENVFVEQLKNFFCPQDVVIGISGSGNSKNVIKAIEYANQNDGISVGLTGFEGGQLKENAKFCINANINNMQLSEDIHIILNHLVMSILLEKL